MKALIPFAAFSLCATGFSAIIALNYKYRSKIDVEREIRAVISKIKLRFQKLRSAKQCDPFR
jgi:hypothetical protein